MDVFGHYPPALLELIETLALTVECPECGAWIGWRCTCGYPSDTWSRFRDPHVRRVATALQRGALTRTAHHP